MKTSFASGAVLLFSFCVLGHTSGAAQAVGGPIHKKEDRCRIQVLRNIQEWKRSSSRFFNGVTRNNEKSLVAEEGFLEGLGIYFRLMYSVRTFRVKPGSLEALVFLPVNQPSFDWRCIGSRPVLST